MAARLTSFPISRDPPEGGTRKFQNKQPVYVEMFPISRDPPEGGTPPAGCSLPRRDPCCSFQFLGIPPKGEPGEITGDDLYRCMFPISRDPPEGGTKRIGVNRGTGLDVSNF